MQFTYNVSLSSSSPLHLNYEAMENLYFSIKYYSLARSRALDLGARVRGICDAAPLASRMYMALPAYPLGSSSRKVRIATYLSFNLFTSIISRSSVCFCRSLRYRSAGVDVGCTPEFGCVMIGIFTSHDIMFSSV